MSRAIPSSKEILCEAAKLIEQGGWVQGRYGDGMGAYCLVKGEGCE